MIDGDKGSNSFTCTLDSIESDVLAGTSVYFQIDLGDVFKLDQVKMWRYFADGRTYPRIRSWLHLKMLLLMQMIPCCTAAFQIQVCIRTAEQ